MEKIIVILPFEFNDFDVNVKKKWKEKGLTFETMSSPTRSTRGVKDTIVKRYKNRSHGDREIKKYTTWISKEYTFEQLLRDVLSFLNIQDTGMNYIQELEYYTLYMKDEHELEIKCNLRFELIFTERKNNNLDLYYVMYVYIIIVML